MEQAISLPTNVSERARLARALDGRHAVHGAGWATHRERTSAAIESLPVQSVIDGSEARGWLRPAAAPRVDDARIRASAAMIRYAQGDDRAFEEVYETLAPRLHRLCIYLIGRGEADDLLQEVFLKMHRARATFVPGGSVVAWSFAIARTTCVDRMRRKKRRPEDSTEQDQLEAHPSCASSCPESSSSGRALEEVLERQLAALSESLRSAYVLVKLEGLACAEAGAVLGLSTSAVKQRVHRASEELKAGLAQAGW